jgi:hypothetical protein
VDPAVPRAISHLRDAAGGQVTGGVVLTVRDSHKRRRGVIITALLLAAAALGVYLGFIAIQILGWR